AGSEAVPAWSADLPRGGRVRRSAPAAEPAAVYLPSCLNTLFAPAPGGTGVMAAVRRLADRAGLPLLVPDGVASLCCGTPWSSKGLPSGYAVMRDRVREVLHAATDGGRLPVVTDAASCTEGLHRLLEAAPDLRVVDAVTFVADHVLPQLPPGRRLASLALHPTCSSVRLGLDAAIARIAEAVAERVVVPDGWQCCGFAGDRGLLHPELTASATRAEAAAAVEGGHAAYASVNRTCELGMSRATGEDYHHLLELLDQVTSAPA
ncbi:MAG: (Fe-S)-binding protein, partial [Hamadaea sp.]|nr:(Fe-S)-binding protein [Hamadaea sp.]